MRIVCVRPLRKADSSGLWQRYGAASLATSGRATCVTVQDATTITSIAIFTLTFLKLQGRAIAGEDTLESLTSRAGAYAKRVRWVNANRDALANCIRTKMAALVAA